MSKKIDEYFKRRFINQEQTAHKLTLANERELKKIYREAREELEQDLAFFIERYSEKNELTIADLEVMLNTKEKAKFRYTVKGYVEEIERLGVNTKEAKALKKELDIMAGKVRVSRKQELITGINYTLGKTGLKTTDVTHKHLKEVVNYSIKDTQATLGNTLAKFDNKLSERIISQNWKGANYSSRIWSNTEELAKKVSKNILIGINQGHEFKRMSEKLSKDMTTGFYQARRVMETETTGALENAKEEVYKKMGIEKYKFIATIDDRTSNICRGLDGKIFLLKDRQIGVNCPFMHPFCRSVTVPVVDREKLERMKTKLKKEQIKDLAIKINKIKDKKVEKELVKTINNIQEIKKDIYKESNFSKDIENILKKEFGELSTNKIILRNERLEHIKERHPEVVEIIKNNFENIVNSPDYILKDSKNENTVLFIKLLEDKHYNTVIKLSLDKNLKNSIITAYKTRKNYIKKILENNKLL